MKESLILKETFETEPSVIYNAWLDSESHSKMTGGAAQCSKVVGDSHSAWDGYIWGKNVELITNKKIVQTWRTSEFDEKDEDSILTIEFVEKSEGKTELTLTHTSIPVGQTQYKQGWIEYYFDPMKDFFRK
ncbi:MAG: SRPBCC domain-containing protein [bacterium]|nr:SRPBCC domain-containing protein [bacterium]